MGSPGGTFWFRKRKSEGVKWTFSILNFDIIAIFETWIQSDSITEFQINGYELFSVRRKTKGGGGVVLYMSSRICQLLTDKSVSIDLFRGPCAVKGNVQVAGHVKRVDHGAVFYA